MKIKKYLMVTALLFSLSVSFLSACTTWKSSVAGQKIIWDGSTTYSIVWNKAISTWNQLNPIDIIPDNWYLWETLTIYDYYDNSYSAPNATYYYHTGSIKFNKAKMKKFNPEMKRNVATHELGHALGLTHTRSPIANSNLNIMYKYTQEMVDLGQHDIYSYNQRWN